MKRRELVALIRRGADTRGLTWELVRQGREHEVWSLEGRLITIPRHSEIKPGTARAILRSFEDELGRRWWET